MDRTIPEESRLLLNDIFRAVIKAVDPYALVVNELGRIEAVRRRADCRRLLVVGFGKAAYPMAKAVADASLDIALAGKIITKCGHLGTDVLPGAIACFEAGHPVPDENGLNATGEIVQALRGVDDRTLVLCLVSGGGSALLAAPLPRITLQEKRELTQALLTAGADIRELNTVRKHISRVKGGRLAEMAYPAEVLSLILSDVIGDPLDVIASGPTAPDETTYGDALAVIDRYALRGRIPAAVTETLEMGFRGEIPETPKAGDGVFAKVENVIVGNSRIALGIAAAKAKEAAYETTVLTAELTGEAADAGRWLAGKALDAQRSLAGIQGKRICLIAGGETTVAVRGGGRGGRNMELALAFAIEIAGTRGITLLSAGTDGTDGPTDAAGAFADGATVERAAKAGMTAEAYLKNNDSYTFFKDEGGLFITGPTGTNVMDVRLLLAR